MELGQLIQIMWDGILETLYMTLSSTLLAYAFGIPLGVVLFITDKDGIAENGPVNKVLGVIVNYAGAPKGDPMVLFLGVALVVVAIILNAVASGKMKRSSATSNTKGVWIAIIAGILMSFFYRFVAAAMDLNNFESPTPGMATPYSAFFIFAVGIFLSNLVFNTIVMRRPFEGKPVTYSAYFRGNFSTHMVGVFGGIIWGLGTALSYIAAGKAGAAISYALGQGAPMIAALWGIFVWREFRGAPRSVGWLLMLMFIFFLSGLGAIIISGAN